MAFLAGRSGRFTERLLEVGNNVVDVFIADRNPNQILSHATTDALFFGELLMRCGPWVYS